MQCCGSLPKKMVSKLSEIWSGLFIPDPDPDFLSIPDPGVKKPPDPGSLIRIPGIMWKPKRDSLCGSKKPRLFLGSKMCDFLKINFDSLLINPGLWRRNCLSWVSRPVVTCSASPCPSYRRTSATRQVSAQFSIISDSGSILYFLADLDSRFRCPEMLFPIREVN
jgi:hypothetical protein